MKLIYYRNITDSSFSETRFQKCRSFPLNKKCVEDPLFNTTATPCMQENAHFHTNFIHPHWNSIRLQNEMQMPKIVALPSTLKNKPRLISNSSKKPWQTLWKAPAANPAYLILSFPILPLLTWSLSHISDSLGILVLPQRLQTCSREPEITVPDGWMN